jgi:hypothetical protein
MMKTNNHNSQGLTSMPVRIVAATVLFLLIPLIAMQFTDEVVWGLFDFAIAALLLLSSGFAYWLIARNLSSTATKAIIAAVLLLAFVLIWMELAVGIFGTPLAGN